MQYYAHSKENEPPEHWQPLEEHLANVAKLAGEFAAAFGAKEWGKVAGLLHDVGKSSSEFQSYLHAVSNADSHEAEAAGKVDHSTAGAQEAVRHINLFGHLLAYPLAGHHSGLLDGIGGNACMQKRLGKKIPNVRIENFLAQIGSLPVPERLKKTLAKKNGGFAAAFFGRMLFSCLVDADFLDTEQSMDVDRAAKRPVWPAKIMEQMEKALDGFVNGFTKPVNEVDKCRADVRRDCLQAANSSPGFFSLTVPTGGGKTLASLAFALKHARLHGLSRIVYVIPFTSIIEQNADVFRNVLREVSAKFGEVVLEHHSSFDAEKETATSRLASENWDAPLVVTTSVQFYESLFANRSRRCRKLHNLANSVIILDEVQTLPVDFLAPCLQALKELARGYGASVVLCTATQPAVEVRSNFPIGLDEVTPIISDSKSLYERLKRVTLEKLGPLNDAELIDKLRCEHQCLCIVNTRGHALKLYNGLGASEEHIHLSASMCPAHRSEVLMQIRARLDNGLPCRVISTQLVEAGVDISFPTVFRSLAGADAIAQAAGRCNRNGELREGGKVYIFQSEHMASEQYFAETANCAKQILELYPDIIGLEAMEHYFQLYYWSRQDRWDAKKICDLFHLDGSAPEFPFLFSYATAASKFRLINSTQLPVIIPWNEDAESLCDKIRYSNIPDWSVLRKLQRYTVQVRRKIWEQHIGRTIEHVHGQFPILISCDTNYSPDTGLDLEDCGGFLEI